MSTSENSRSTTQPALESHTPSTAAVGSQLWFASDAVTPSVGR